MILYCLSIGDWTKDVNSVAVPLIHPKHGILTFNCGAPSYILDQEKLENEIGPRLIHMVNNIALSLNNIWVIGSEIENDTPSFSILLQI